jgi:hypothetical protein
LAKGEVSLYQTQVPNRAFLIQGKEAWKKFYNSHNPGAAVPSVDFTKNTVLVVVAGMRPTQGFKVDVKLVRWSFPFFSATAAVVETPPPAGATPGFSNPYHILLLKEKVSSLHRTWSIP